MCYINQGTPSAPGSPWPLPQKWLKTEITYTLNPDNFQFILTKNETKCDIVTEAIERYRGIIFLDERGSHEHNHTQLEEMYIDIEDAACGYPAFGDTENYSLEIPMRGKEAHLRAKSVWGVLRGLETFSQLVYQNSNRSYMINATRISDWPQYKYRGLLIDTARHFIPMKVLLDNLV